MYQDDYTSYASFKLAHSKDGEPINCQRRNLVLFADGAATQWSDGDVRYDPPKDRKALLLNLRDYHELHLKRIRSDFNRSQQFYAQDAACDGSLLIKDLENRSREHAVALQKIKAELATIEAAERTKRDPMYFAVV